MGILAIAAIAWAVSPIQAGAEAFFSETTKDFGTSPKGPVLVHHFYIKNTSNQTVSMGTPRIQCGCVSVSLQKSTLAPGEQTTLVAQMDTKKIPAQQLNVLKSVAVYVPFLAPNFEEVTIKVLTVARDDLYLSPDTISIGTVRKGQAKSASVKLTMFTQPNWEIQEVTSSGAYVKTSFKLLKREGNEVTYQVTATVEDDCPAGNWISDAWVKTNALGLEKFRVPVGVNVIPAIAASPGTLNFGDVNIGKATSKQVILNGASEFQLLEIKPIAGMTITPVTQGAKATHILNVSFDPKSRGNVSQKIEIRTDSKTAPDVIVPVSAIVK